MKKLISILLCATMLLGAVSVFAATPEGTYYDKTERCVITGTASTGNSTVTVLLMNGNQVVYANETTAKIDGSYKFAFSYKGGSVSDIKVMQDGNVITNTVDTAVSYLEALSVNLKYFEKDGFASALTEVKNEYGITDDYKIIFAFYKNGGKELAGAPVIFTAKTDENKGSAFATALPEGTTLVKAFAWRDLSSSLTPLATPEKVEDETYKDGSVVGVIGDSITAGVGTETNYGVYLDYIYKLRFLDTKDVKFFNKGTAGDTSAGALGRIDWDILSLAEQNSSNPDERSADDLAKNVYKKDPDSFTIMMGANNFAYDANAEVQEVNQSILNSVDVAASSLESLVEGLIAKGIKPEKITILSPFVWEKVGDKAFPTALNEGFRLVSKKYKETAEKLGTKYIDVHTPLRTMQTEYGFSFSSGDMVHTSSYGHLIVAAEMAKSQGISPVVASVAIDGNNVNAANATVSNLVTNGEISFTYKPNSLPLAVNSDYTAVKNAGYDIENTLNREILIVKGLTGSHTVTLNGTSIGSFTGEELANGINIAEYTANPNQVKAQTIYNDYKSLFKDIYNIRRIYANTKPQNGSTRTFAEAKALLASLGVDYDANVTNIGNMINTINGEAVTASYTITIK